MRWLTFMLFFIAIIANSCNQKVERRFVQQVKASQRSAIPTSYELNNKPCREKMNYVPDLEHLDHTPVKTVKVNFHIMCKEDGSGNFSEERGRTFVKLAIKESNIKLKNNKKMRLPLGNETPVIPMRYKYELTPDPKRAGDDGIYFHYDDDLYYMLAGGPKQNNYKQDVFKKYGVQKDTVLNVFVMGVHVDSLKSKKYKPSGRGIAFGTWVKVAAWSFMARKDKWKNGKPEKRRSAIGAMRLLNHEIGHTLGLRHTWRGNDGCEDTPTSPNCWNRTRNNSKCDSLYSNNFMDYNAHSSAWSPCQIGTIHYNLHKRPKLRRLLVPTWCTFDEAKNIFIDETIDWNGAKDLEGHLIVKTGAQLTIRCKVSMPPASRVIIHPGGRLILDGGTLYNDCGKEWVGIEILEYKKQKGEVLLTNDAKIQDAEYKVEVKEQEPVE